MKSFVVINREYLDAVGFLHPYCFEATRAIPCAELPRDAGYYLEIKPLSLEGPDPLSDQAGPAFDGSIRVPHSVVELIVDSADDRLLGFLDRSSDPPVHKE